MSSFTIPSFWTLNFVDLKQSQIGTFYKESSVFESLMCRVLILNSTYQPLKLVSWQKGLLLWFQGKVDVLEYHGQLARSASDAFQLPSVMRLHRFVSYHKTTRLKFSRQNIYLRDNFTCQYCGNQFASSDLTLDHVIPASKLGQKNWTNMVTACRPCNHKKGNKTPLAAGMPLINEPKIPNWLPAVEPHLSLGEEIPDNWLPYLGTG